MKKLLSDSSKLLVKFLLTKPKIAEKVFVDVKNNKEYKIYDVLDDGTIYLGESSIPFWNHLIKCEKKIPFELFALRVWDAVVGLADENAKTIIAEGLSKDILNNAIRDDKYDEVVNRLIDVVRLSSVDPSLKSSGTPNILAYIKNNIHIDGNGLVPVMAADGKPLFHVVFKAAGVTYDNC